MISFDTVPGGAAASAVFLEEAGVRVGVGGLLIPHRIAILGQYNSGKTPTVNVPVLISSADEAASLYGRGSMLHLMARKSFAQAPNVPIYTIPLAEAGGGTAATGSIVATSPATGAGTLALFIGGQKVQVGIASGDTTSQLATKIAAAINAALDLPVTASANTATVTLTARHKGTFGNDIRIQRDLDSGDAAASPAGVALTLNAMSTGATNPDATTALANLGGTWYTVIASPYQDATNIAALEAAAALRAGSDIKRPFLAVFGYTGTKANFQSAVSARNSKFAAWVPVEDSPSIPAEVAACAAALFGARQQIQPGTPMRGRTLVGIRAGQAASWTYSDEQTTVLSGGSTTRSVFDGTIVMMDFATTYKTNPLGATDETYRFANWLGNWQTKLYSLDTVFLSAPFIDAVVVDDNAVTSVEYAISPNTVKAYAVDLVRLLWEPLALTKEADAVVAGIKTEIDSTNPGRINLLIPDVHAAGLRIIAGRVQWSFYAPATAA